MYGPFYPQSVEIACQDDKLWVSVREYTAHPVLIGVAFVDNHTAVQVPGRRTIPTPLGVALWRSGDPNCQLTYHNDVHYLWSLRDLYPHEPMTIDDRLYHL